MRSIGWKLGGALLIIVLVSVGLMAYLTNQKTVSEFGSYVQYGHMAYSQNIADSIGQYYTREKSWSGVQDFLAGVPKAVGDRLIITDSSGKIVGDTGNIWIGRNAKDIPLSGGITIDYTGQQVGTLYIILSTGAVGRGRMIGGMGMMGQGSQVYPVDVAAGDFLNRINSYLWLAGLIATVIALLIGLILTRQIIRPLRALTDGAHNITRGNLGYRVKINSRDELGELARSFNSMADSLDKSEQSRRRLVSDVAHELRTPLTIIEGTVDGILDGVFKPDTEHLVSIKEQTASLTRLVKDLRDLSLAESGQLKLDLAPADITEMVKRKIAQFEVKVSEKNIHLLLDFSTVEIEANIDSFRMEQVMTNLLTNAIRHTPPGGQVNIGVKLQSEKNSILITIADTGEGIPAEHLPHIFERFYRVQDARSRSDGGAGLGLAIVKQMVEAHGGNVSVESEVGKGTTFFIEIPAMANLAKG